MNFKFFLFLFSLLSLSACGVKAPPVKYPETVVESYVKGYTGAEPTPEELARNKNKKPIESTPEPVKIPALLPQP